MGFFNGTKGKVKKASTLTPEQEQLMQLISQGLTSGEGPFGELFGDFDQKKFEEGVSKPAMKNFQEEILPQLQEKFIAGNQVLGSGMRRGQLKAGVDLQDKLAQLMYGAQKDQSQNKLSGINSLLGKQGVENIYKPGTKGAGQGMLEGLSQGAGQALGSWGMAKLG